MNAHDIVGKLWSSATLSRIPASPLRIDLSALSVMAKVAGNEDELMHALIEVPEQSTVTATKSSKDL